MSSGGSNLRTLRESLIVLSDVHLGRHLAGPVLEPKPHRTDRDLVRLLAHYRRTAPSGDRWRLVIAGDFVDFIGITVPPDVVPLQTEPSDEEREHGIGNAEDHARAKMRLVAEHHRDVFAALAAFVSDGHALTIVHGNHDVEFHWDAAKAELRAALLEHCLALDPDVDADAFLARVDFHPWFFYVDGVAYIEHGHQYDAFCATEHIMAPISPLDPRRIARGFTDILIRYIVRPTRGMKEYGHEHMGVFDYLGFGIRLGVKGAWSLLVRFVVAVQELFRLRRQYLTDAARALREEHERRMALLAEATRIGIDRIQALAALQTPPITRSIRGILASVLLDRIALGVLTGVLLVAFGVLGYREGHVFAAAASVLAGWSVANRYLAKQRQIDATGVLHERAGQLARLFPAAFVVMGHTHVPAKTPVADGAATYVNLGAWADDDEDSNEGLAPRTHLVIRVGENGPVGEFLRWDPESGPTAFLTAPPPESVRRS